MTTQSLRFLCAGGFHLHAVLDGISDAPEHLLELLTSAPYRATEQIFQAALRDEVDFVLLTGDLLDAASGGPGGVAFLRRQFELMHDNGIPVYWAASQLDLSSDWLEHVELPNNVHVFSNESVESMTVVVRDRPAAVVLGRSWNAQRPLRVTEFSATTSEARHVAVLYGSCDLDSLSAHIDFWATGGSNETTTSIIGQQVVHGAGLAQGLSPRHSGAHGCTLVHIDSAGDVRTRHMDTDVVRWAQEQVVVPEGASLADVRNALRLRTQKLSADAGRLVLVQWTLTGDGWFSGPLVHPHRRNELLAWLRDEFGKGSQPVWALSLEIEPPERFRDEWTDEDSILGDYLRVAREYLEDEAKALILEPPPVSQDFPEEVQTALSLGGAIARAKVLREAALIGVGLLRGDDRPLETALSTGRNE